MTSESTQERFKRGAADAGQFFFYIADFIDFTEEDAQTIRETRFIIEKHIPSIVADFYTQLLRFPATRVHFLRKDGTIDQEYLELRMRHQANFWRRAASGDYDEDFARYVDYVGRSHTSRGADPKIYIPERYVIGMVAFVQRRVNEALASELADLDPDLERRAGKAWNALLMVVLELLSRAYRKETEAEKFEPGETIDDQAVFQLSVESYERALGMARSIEHKEVFVARVEEIPEGERTIIQVDDLSIGVFHHQGEWIALHNSCLHRGGPVCEGKLEGDVITCPWHGYQYDVCDGHLLFDKSVSLPQYTVEIRGDEIYLHIPILVRDEVEISLDSFDVPELTTEKPSTLDENEFWLDQLPPGQITLVHVEGEPVAVYNLEGTHYATHDHCTHSGGPLSDGHLEGTEVICPWHDSCFDVTNGQVTCGPATEDVKTYQVLIDGEKGVVEENR